MTFFIFWTKSIKMYSSQQYMDNDGQSVSSVETYYSHEAVSSDHEDYEEEYYDENREFFLEEVPYLKKPLLIEKPTLIAVKTKIPEINPWSKVAAHEIPKDEKPKSFLELVEEEKNIEEEKKRKKKEEEERKARFKRKKVFNFISNKDKPSGSLLLRHKYNTTHGKSAFYGKTNHYEKQQKKN